MIASQTSYFYASKGDARVRWLVLIRTAGTCDNAHVNDFLSIIFPRAIIDHTESSVRI